jgi:hypothetical protein
MTGDTEYQLVTLKRALGRNCVVCRLRSHNGAVRIDVFWSPPRMQRNLRPFASMQPLSLLADFTSNGFARVNDGALEHLGKAGILVASFASGAVEGAALARSIINRHGLGRSDRVVARKSRRAARPAAGRLSSPTRSEPKRAAGDGW